MDGQQALRTILQVIPDGIPVLVDAKRGDTPQTMQAYARAIFDDLGADAVTVSPYLGRDSLEPFFAYADRGVFVLCKTSNPGAGEIQDLRGRGRRAAVPACGSARDDLGAAGHARPRRRRHLPARRGGRAQRSARRADPAAGRRRAGRRPGRVGHGGHGRRWSATRSSTPAGRFCTPSSQARLAGGGAQRSRSPAGSHQRGSQRKVQLSVAERRPSSRQ